MQKNRDEESRSSAEQISTALRQVASESPVAEVTSKLEVSGKTYYLWKKQHAPLLTNELRNCGDYARRTPSSSDWWPTCCLTT